MTLLRVALVILIVSSILLLRGILSLLAVALLGWLAVAALVAVVVAA